MKKLIIMTVAVLFSQQLLAANKTKLSWTPPTTNTDGTPLTDLGGYKLYCGPKTGNYTVVKDVANIVEYLILNVVSKDGTYFCAVTAYNIPGNESGYSNEVNFSIDYTSPNPPIENTPKIESIPTNDPGILTISE